MERRQSKEVITKVLNYYFSVDVADPSDGSPVTVQVEARIRVCSGVVIIKDDLRERADLLTRVAELVVIQFTLDVYLVLWLVARREGGYAVVEFDPHPGHYVAIPRVAFLVEAADAEKAIAEYLEKFTCPNCKGNFPPETAAPHMADCRPPAQPKEVEG